MTKSIHPGWWALNRIRHSNPIFKLTFQHGKIHQRREFVKECFQKSKNQRKTICGSFLGFHDLFVPIFYNNELQGYLQSGTFSKKNFSFSDLQNAWTNFTGYHQVDDHHDNFRFFCQTILSTPILTEPLFDAYKESLELFALVLGDNTHPHIIKQRLHDLLIQVISKKTPHLYWLNWALGITADESTPIWERGIENLSWIQEELRITRIPTTVITVVPNQLEKKSNPIEKMLLIHSFQKECFQFAQTLPETVGGALNNYGGVFVTSTPAHCTRLQKRSQIGTLAEKIHDFASKELGCPVVVGVGETVAPGESLNNSYHQSIQALHYGRNSGKKIIFYSPAPTVIYKNTVQEFQEFLVLIQSSLASGTLYDLQILKDRFLDTVLRLSNNQPEELYLHLNYSLLFIVQAVKNNFEMHSIDLTHWLDQFRKKLENSLTANNMVHTFNETFDQLTSLLLKPSILKKTLIIDDIKKMIDENFSKPLRLKEVAKSIGLSSSSFSLGFKKLTGFTFEGYIQNQRLNESKRLLQTSSLPIRQIGVQCGYHSYSYFIQLFKKNFKTSPGKFRTSHSRI